MRFAIVRFPGTWSDVDCFYAVTDGLHQQAAYVWHRETSLDGFDCVVLPGGFAHGDYLRCGAIARFSPIMDAVARHAAAGRPVFGICNGFQVLCEAGLLPGALLRNASLQFRCEWVNLRTETISSPFTALCKPGEVLRIPISHGEGSYYADTETLRRLGDEDRVAFRYCAADGSVTQAANPNGSLENIAGVLNEGRNVLGMMPHPERAVEDLLGGHDGLVLWRSLVESFAMSR
ncbi:MAG: phosphoribosylformylglycinamidine synthase subunit PurQ [Dehalococcoidia bacterium]